MLRLLGGSAAGNEKQDPTLARLDEWPAGERARKTFRPCPRTARSAWSSSARRPRPFASASAQTSGREPCAGRAAMGDREPGRLAPASIESGSPSPRRRRPTPHAPGDTLPRSSLITSMPARRGIAVRGAITRSPRRARSPGSRAAAPRASRTPGCARSLPRLQRPCKKRGRDPRRGRASAAVPHPGRRAGRA